MYVEQNKFKISWSCHLDYKQTLSRGSINRVWLAIGYLALYLHCMHCLSLIWLNWLLTQYCYKCKFLWLQVEPGWTIFYKTGHSSMHALQFDLGQARQGFLASLTNFWPHQLQPVQGNNCRPNVSAIPRQALLVLTPASRSLSRPWRPFMFFAFPSQFWPRPTVARPGRADPVAAASLFFFSPGQLGQSPACGWAHPGFQARLWPWSTLVWLGSWCKGLTVLSVLS